MFKMWFVCETEFVLFSAHRFVSLFIDTIYIRQENIEQSWYILNNNLILNLHYKYEVIRKQYRNQINIFEKIDDTKEQENSIYTTHKDS